MDQKMTALERAFQLARSGRIAAVSEIATSLKLEGYQADQVEGPASVMGAPKKFERGARVRVALLPMLAI